MSNDFFNPIFNIGRIKMHPLVEGEMIKSVFYLKELTKQNNMKEYKNFINADINGYKSIQITSPFNKAKNFFEVGYTSFAKCDDDEYILKIQKRGKKNKIIGYPLKDNSLPIIDFGEATEETIKEFGLALSGVLRCQIKGFSDFGEVFLFATKNKDTINAISNSLKTIENIVGGLEGIELTLKALETRVKILKVKYDEDEGREYVEQVETIKPFLKISTKNILKAREEHFNYIETLGKTGEIDKIWEENSNTNDLENVISYQDAIVNGKIFEFEGIVDSDNNNEHPTEMSEDEIDDKNIAKILKQINCKNCKESKISVLLRNLYRKTKKDEELFKKILQNKIIKDDEIKNNNILKEIALLNTQQVDTDDNKKQGSLL